MALGTQLKELRLKMGWTQSQLGEKINVTKSSISGYENNTRSPDKDTLVKLANLFNVSTDYLLGNIDSKQHKNLANETEYTDTDLDNMLDNAMSFDGVPITDHDREIIRAYLKGKYSK